MEEKGKNEIKIMTLQFNEELKKIIKPKNQSDRTTFRRVAETLERGIIDKKYTIEIFRIVLDWAREAAGPQSRNPAAVFMKILKEEINYGKSEDQRVSS